MDVISSEGGIHIVFIIAFLLLLGMVALIGWKTRSTAANITDTLNDIESETSFNGGSSLKDMIKSLYDSQQETHADNLRANFRLEIMSDAVGVPLYETDASGTTVWCNHAYMDFWEFKSMDEARSEAWIEKLTPAGRELAVTRLTAILRTKAPFRYTNHLKSGGMVEFVGEPIFTDNEFKGWTGSVRMVDEDQGTLD